MKMNQITLAASTALLLCITTAPLSAGSILPQGGSVWSPDAPTLGDSWDNPPSTAVTLAGGNVNEYLTQGGDPGMFSFSAGTYDITLLDENAGYASVNEFLWAPVSDPLNLNQIFSGPDSPVQSQTISPTEEWAFVIKSGSGNVFSSNTIDRFLAMRDSDVPNKWYVGVEDLNPGDFDLNDGFFRVEGKMAPVPEPSTWSMIALGGFFLGWARSRQKKD